MSRALSRRIGDALEMWKARRSRQAISEQLTKKRLAATAGGFAAVCGILGVSVFEGGGLVDVRSSRSQGHSARSFPEAPANMPVEIKASYDMTVFVDDVGVPPGVDFQVLLSVRNIGQSEASDATIRVALPEGVRLHPGSCQTRSSDRPGLRPCGDNLVNGGFLYRRFGGGAWVQIYFDAEFLRRPSLERVWTLRAIVNSNETAELTDTVRIYPVARKG